MSGYILEFELPGLPKSQTNNYGHWHSRSRSKKEWEERVHFATVGMRPREPLTKAKVTLTRCSAAPPDADNLCASFKPILDGLTKAGIIEDDNMSVIGFPDYKWEKAKPKRGKVRIRVESIDEGDSDGE